MFMEYRMRAFQGAFHSNPDYMHWYGWAAKKESLRSIKDEAAGLRAEAAAQADTAAIKSQLEETATGLTKLDAEVQELKAK